MSTLNVMTIATALSERGWKTLARIIDRAHYNVACAQEASDSPELTPACTLSVAHWRPLSGRCDGQVQALCVASRSMTSSNCRIFWPLIRFLSNSGIRFRMVRETVARAMLRRIRSAFSYALYERRQTPSSSAALSRLQPRPFLHNLSSYPVISAIQKVQILHLF